MRTPTAARDRERARAGVIDTLSLGYTTINRHPWILAVPILLDLLFWLGPRLSLAPLVERALTRFPAVALPADVSESYEEYRQGLSQLSEGFNLLSLLASNFPGVPSLMAGRAGSGPVIELSSSAEALGLFVLVAIAGVLVASLYYTFIGRGVRSDPETFGATLRRGAKTWVRVLVLLALALTAMLVLGVPVAIVALILGTINSSLLGFVASFLLVTAIWVQFYLFFVVDAIVISDASALQAVRNSVALVRFNLGPGLGLIILVWVIMLGMSVVWSGVAQTEWGIAAGILGNAYVSTGLATAAMIFYRDRFATIESRPGR